MPSITIVTAKSCLGYEALGHPESPERVSRTQELLARKDYPFVEAVPCTDEDILSVHTQSHFNLVKVGGFDEADTPDLPGMFEHAKKSAGAAIQAAELALKGQGAFSLMRPPGHHATRHNLMGFCYFNNIAIAVTRLVKEHSKRVAIVDFDCHHGNGTEDIFVGNPDVLFVSLHQSPCYPYTGTRNQSNCVNFPLPPSTREREFLLAVDSAMEHVASFKPDLVAVSAGFDSHKDDPITHMALEIGTFREIGARIRGLELPVFSVLEGGYSHDLPSCIAAYLEGLSESR